MTRQGFTLLELSIVLVIIGLIVGGVVAGQGLIKNAELNSIVQDVNKYNVAMATYMYKYDSIAGDHKNAYDYFDGSGGSSVCGGDTLSYDGSQGCNGDGNGQIQNSFEAYRAWTHLRLAGLIGGNYAILPSMDIELGVHIPAGSIDGSGFLYEPGFGQRGLNFAGIYEQFGMKRFGGGVLVPSDAASIDNKIDNGLPGKGIVTSFTGGGAADNCVIGSQPNTTYELDNETRDCMMYFIPAFAI